MTDKQKLICESMVPLIIGLRKYPNDSCFKHGLSKIIRRFTEYPADIGIPYMYSIGALRAAENIGLSAEKLMWTGYLDQTTKRGLQDIGHGTGIFHHEHIIPISQTIQRMLKLEDLTAETLYNLLIENYKIAWILKSEQKILDANNKSTIRTPELLNVLQIYIKGFNYND